GPCQHAALEEAHQGPSTRHVEYHLAVFQLDLVQVKAIGLHKALDPAAALVNQLLIKAVEQGGVNIRPPGYEPLSRKGQHALGRREASDFLIQPDQSATAQAGL